MARPLPAELLLGPLDADRAVAAGADHRDELIVYGPDVHEIARHAARATPGDNEKRTCPSTRPVPTSPAATSCSASGSRNWERRGRRSSRGSSANRRYGKEEAHRVLGLLATYERDDLLAALDRACRYRAYSLTAIERILAAQAQPRAPLAALAIEAADRIPPALREDSVPPRSGAEYLHLLDENHDDGQEDS